MKLIKFVKGSHESNIIVNGPKSFTAVTLATSKNFKTEKGAEKYMNKYGFVRA